MDSYDSSYKFPKLKGNENYDSWKVDIAYALKAEGLWWVTSGKLEKPIPTGDLTPAAKEKHNSALLTWEDKNDRACAMIIFATEQGPRVHIGHIEVAIKMWSILKDLYEESDIITLHLALKELTQSKQSDFKSIQEYADSLKIASIKCSNTGNSLPDWVLGHLFLLGLNEGLEPYVFGLIQVAKANNTQLNITDMAVDLAYYDKRLSHEESSKGLAVKCDKSKSGNHNRFRKDSDKVSICGYCKRRGHIKQECYKLNPKLRPEEREPSGNRKKLAKEDSGKSSGVKIVRCMKASESSQDVATNAQWIDSGAENHVCYVKELFEMESYRKATATNIITANNEALPITGKETVSIFY